MATIRDVAKQAGVGVGTVSRALNGTGHVSPETKKKIEDAASKLGYTPNELARNLFRNRTGIIGLIVPDLHHSFFSCFAKYVEMELYKQGYKTMICNSIGISDREKEYLDMLERNMVDGIITAAHSLDGEEYLKQKKILERADSIEGTNKDKAKVLGISVSTLRRMRIKVAEYEKLEEQKDEEGKEDR